MSLAVALFVLAGGYVGYLSALVDYDEQVFLERVRAVTDKARLERQLARAQSILDARRRAYLRRSQQFLQERQVDLGQQASVDQVDQALAQFERLPDQQIQQSLEALGEEREDLGFFEDEVDVLEQIIAREPDQDELNLLFAGLKQRRRISSGLRELLQLLDKRRELAQKRVEVKRSYNYWEQFPQAAPSSVNIAVQNKGGVQRDLNPQHITQITTALSIMPQGFESRLRNLYVVYGDPNMRRGLAGVGVVFMKGEELDFFRVLVHEFGHIYDLHREVNTGEKSPFYDGPYRLYATDPSVEFYSYTWANNYDRLEDLPAFASSYATSDPFEDFAEAFALYVLQGETFRRWSRQNATIAQKYQFISRAFNGREFPSVETYSARPYDVTMLSVDYERLLGG